MKTIEQMNRTEVIEALRSVAHPSTFHSLLTWSTAHLKGLLAYYREDDKEPRIIPKRCACGLHWEHTGKHAPHTPGISIEIEVIHFKG